MIEGTAALAPALTLFDTRDAATGALQLREYQRADVERVDAGWETSSAQVLAAPTGAGKTAMASWFMRRTVEDGGSAWFVAHLTTLTSQSVARFGEYGIDVGLVQAQNTKDETMRALVCSGQTIEARDFARIGRKLECDPALCVPNCDRKVCYTLYAEEFDLERARLPDMLILDESHQAYRYSRRLARAVQANGGRVLGLTATPYADWMSLSYEGMVAGTSTRDLIGIGALVPYRYFEAVQIFDMSNKSGRGEIRPTNMRRRGQDADYSDRQIAEAVRYDVMGDMPDEWVRHTSNVFGGPVKTLIASPTIAIGESIATAFEEQLKNHADPRYRGLRFQVCSAKDGADGRPRTEEVLRRFDSREVVGLVSVAKLAIGFDRPEAQCLVLARPFATLTPYVQWLGRVLRTAEGKSEALILDHAGNMVRLGPAFAKHVDAGPPGLARLPEPSGVETAISACCNCGRLFKGRAEVCQLCVQTVPPPQLAVALGEMREIDFGFRSLLYMTYEKNAEALWFDISRGLMKQFPKAHDLALGLAQVRYSMVRTPAAHYVCLHSDVADPCMAHPAAISCRVPAPDALHASVPAEGDDSSADLVDLIRIREMLKREVRARAITDLVAPQTFRCAECMRFHSIDDAAEGTSPLVCREREEQR